MLTYTAQPQRGMRRCNTADHDDGMQQHCTGVLASAKNCPAQHHRTIPVPIRVDDSFRYVDRWETLLADFRWPQRVVSCICFSVHAVPVPSPPKYAFQSALGVCCDACYPDISRETHIMKVYWPSANTNPINESSVTRVDKLRKIQSLKYSPSASDCIDLTGAIPFNSRTCQRFFGFLMKDLGSINTLKMRTISRYISRML